MIVSDVLEYNVLELNGCSKVSNEVMLKKEEKFGGGEGKYTLKVNNSTEGSHHSRNQQAGTLLFFLSH